MHTVSWGLWVSQKGVLRDSMKVSCMVMAAGQEDGRSLTDAVTSVAQPRSLRSKNHVCSPILLTQTQQGFLQWPWGQVWGHQAWPLFHSAGQLPCRNPRVEPGPLLPVTLKLTSAQQCPRGILLSQPYFPSPERPFRAGCFCLQIQGRCFEEQDGDGICVRATACCVSSGQGRLVCLTARSLAGLKKLQTLDIGSFCLLVLREPQGGKGPTIFPPWRAPFVCILEGTVFQINGVHPHLDSKMHAVNCAPFSSSGKLRCYTQGPSNSNHLWSSTHDPKWSLSTSTPPTEPSVPKLGGKLFAYLSIHSVVWMTTGIYLHFKKGC